MNSNQPSTGISTLIVSRNSGQHSKVARELAARELHAVVGELKVLTGQDLSSEIPSEQALIQKLQAAKRHKSKTPAGKSFSNENGKSLRARFQHLLANQRWMSEVNGRSCRIPPNSPIY